MVPDGAGNSGILMSARLDELVAGQEINPIIVVRFPILVAFQFPLIPFRLIPLPSTPASPDHNPRADAQESGAGRSWWSPDRCGQGNLLALGNRSHPIPRLGQPSAPVLRI